MPVVPPNSHPLTATAIDGEVVVTSQGPGRPVALSLTPKAVLESLGGLKNAAEAALKQRSKPPAANDHYVGIKHNKY